MSGISVIIAHYALQKLDRNILEDTIASVRTQDYRHEIEIFVADDGSPWPGNLPRLERGQHKIYGLEDIRKVPYLKKLNIDWYIVGPSDNRFNKAILWNICVQMTRFNKLIFLDDDHGFTSKSSIALYDHYLNRYPFVVGRIRNHDGRFRSYYDRSVQGTNFAIQRSLLEAVGGFGEYVPAWGMGVDPDLYWRVFRYFRDRLLLERHPALYAGEIITWDRRSGRWRSKEGVLDKFRQGFIEMFGVDPHNNDSRNKRLWYDHSSKFPLVTEAWFRLRSSRLRHCETWLTHR